MTLGKVEKSSRKFSMLLNYTTYQFLLHIENNHTAILAFVTHPKHEHNTISLKCPEPPRNINMFLN